MPLATPVTDTPYPRLLGPARVGAREVKNRVIMTGMSAHMAPDEGWVTDREVAFYDRRARGGPGYIVVGAAFVHPSGTFGAQLGIHRDEMIPGLARLAGVIKAQGAVASIQLHHAGRQTSSRVTGHELIAPSAIACPVKQETPRAMTDEDVEQALEWYAEGARRAMEAGFDGIEIHGAHGYLPAQFLSPRSNQRDDRYGGSLTNRSRFLLECLRRVRSVVGTDIPLSVKISGEEYAPGGLELNETSQVAAMLGAGGAELITVSAGAAPYFHTVPGMALPPGCFVPAASTVRAATPVPISAVGRITTPDQAEAILEAGEADFISLGRPLIADPDWVVKAAAGQSEAICICIGCNKGCHDPSRSERATACLLNAEAGFERELSIQPAAHSRRVLVIGGGPGGLEAARVARLRGHDVVLCERESYWGGRLHIGTIPPHKAEYQLGIDYLVRQCARLGVDLRLDTRVTPQLVEQLRPDAVILATGSTPAGLPGSANRDDGAGEAQDPMAPQVVLADALLSAAPTDAHHVVLVGGGAVGAEVAHYLGEQGKQVTVLQRSGGWGSGMPPDARWHIERGVEELDVTFHLDTEMTGSAERDVLARHSGGELTIAGVDAIVAATGAMSDRALENDLSAMVRSLEVIGDALEPRSALEAIAEGYRAACRIE